jgi:hypothetical protein
VQNNWVTAHWITRTCHLSGNSWSGPICFLFPLIEEEK